MRVRISCQGLGGRNGSSMKTSQIGLATCTVPMQNRDTSTAKNMCCKVLPGSLFYLHVSPKSISRNFAYSLHRRDSAIGGARARARCHIFSRTTHPELPRSRFQDQTSTLNTARSTEIARYKGSALAQIISLLFLSAAFALRVLCSLFLTRRHVHTAAECSCP